MRRPGGLRGPPTLAAMDRVSDFALAGRRQGSWFARRVSAWSRFLLGIARPCRRPPRPWAARGKSVASDICGEADTVGGSPAAWELGSNHAAEGRPLREGVPTTTLVVVAPRSRHPGDDGDACGRRAGPRPLAPTGRQRSTSALPVRECLRITVPLCEHLRVGRLSAPPMTWLRPRSRLLGAVKKGGASSYRLLWVTGADGAEGATTPELPS